MTLNEDLTSYVLSRFVSSQIQVCSENKMWGYLLGCSTACNFTYPFLDEGRYHIETGPLICSAIPWNFLKFYLEYLSVTNSAQEAFF